MSVFQKLLFIQSSTKKDLKLSTTAIKVLPNVFSINPLQTHLYSFGNTIEIFTTSPVNRISEVDYKRNITQMILMNRGLFILNANEIISHFDDSFNIKQGNYETSRLIRFDHWEVDGKNNSGTDSGNLQNNTIYKSIPMIGVQSSSALSILDCNLQSLQSIPGQCSFNILDTLIVGEFNKCVLYRYSSTDPLANSTHNRNSGTKAFMKLFDIGFPGNLTCVAVVDPLFSKIYAAVDKILYGFDLSGKELTKMEFHTQPIRQILLDFTGSHIYTTDGVNIAVWDSKSGLLIEFITVEDGVEAMDIIVSINRTYGSIPIKIN